MYWEIKTESFNCGQQKRHRDASIRDGVYCTNRDNKGPGYAYGFNENYPKCKSEDCPIKIKD